MDDPLSKRTSYTGPLTAAAATGRVGKPQDTGEHTIILLGLALDCENYNRPAHRVRMEMTPEDAEDLAAKLILLARIAKRKDR